MEKREPMRIAGIEVRAVSVGGVETCIELPQLKLAFDIGRCPPSAVARPTVLFTHAHMDHMGGVAYHAATRALYGMAPPTYVVPHENAAAFEELFAVWRRLDRSELAYQMVALGPGEEHALPNGLIARPFRSPHRVPCQGYALVRRKRKLRPELAALSSAEVHALVREGGEPTQLVESIEVAFTGDTLIEVVEREAAVRRARLLIMEVTFVDERVGVEECRAKGHVHLDELAERADLFQNEALLLTHFSARYTASQILEALDRRLPKHLRERVTPLLPP
jgi:ribonuclease Z